MDTDMDADEKEAFRRNHSLVLCHSRIPSYALWTPDSVGPAETWDQWWTDFNAPNNVYLASFDDKGEHISDEKS
jgi:hypothetical protein